MCRFCSSSSSSLYLRLGRIRSQPGTVLLPHRQLFFQVAGILTGSTQLVGRSLDTEAIIEPVRGPLIPGFFAVKQASKAAGELCKPCLHARYACWLCLLESSHGCMRTMMSAWLAACFWAVASSGPSQGSWYVCQSLPTCTLPYVEPFVEHVVQACR